MTAYLDTNIVIRHLTGDPPKQARRATRYLVTASDLLLADVIVAEIVYVLESYYRVTRSEVARIIRAILAFPPIRVADASLLHRAIGVYEVHRLDFAEAYLVASAERAGVTNIASFDRTIDRVGTVVREAPTLLPSRPRVGGGRSADGRSPAEVSNEPVARPPK